MTSKTVSVTVQSTASPEAIWGVLTDLAHAAVNLPDIVELERISDDAGFNLGTRWRETRKMMGKAATEEMWVTAIDEGSSYVVEAESRGTHYTSEYTVTPHADGSFVRLDFTGELVDPSTLRKLTADIMFALMAGVTRKMFKKDLETIIAVAEKQG